MKVLIVGANGQLATSLRRVLPDSTGLGHEQLDICDAEKVRETVRALSPDAVINAAALRRPDACEDQPDRTFAVNAYGARNLAAACEESGAALVQISSDAVFDGNKTSPYLEEDEPKPINVYGMSKLAGELFVGSGLKKHYIVRTSALFGEGSGTSNFVLLMLKQARESGEVRVVTDQFASPTYTSDLAAKIAWLLTTGAYGTYHIANATGCSWLEFAQAIFQKTGVKAKINPITTAELKPRARRPRYTVLANGALRRLSADDLGPWQDALDRYLGTL